MCQLQLFTGSLMESEYMISFFLNQISSADLLEKHFLFSDELRLHFNSLTGFPRDLMKLFFHPE